LVGVVEHQRLVSLNLRTGATRVRFSDPALTLQPPLAVTKPFETRVVTADGLLLAHDASGNEQARVPLEGIAHPTSTAPSTLNAAAPIVVDAGGAVAFARQRAGFGVAHPDGSVETTEGAACSDPVALAPAGARKLIVACRSGSLWLLGE
jgi:hypothetical protein